MALAFLKRAHLCLGRTSARSVTVAAADGPSSAAEERLTKKVVIFRFDPDNPGKDPQKLKTKTYTVETKRGWKYLDVLNYIKDNMDPTLTYRRSCREGICGSCSMNIQGHNALACILPVPEKDSVLKIFPLPHMYVIKDLVVDMSLFYEQYKYIKPWLIRREEIPPGSRTYTQSVRDSYKLNGLYECIMCACCSTACPSYWWNGRAFLGPATLQQAFRWIVDSRDQATEERLKMIADGFSTFRCHTIYNCTVSCPKNLNPAQSIAWLKMMITEMKSKEKPDLEP